MKKFVQLSFVTMLLITASTATCFAGAWTQPKNGFYEKLGFNFYYSDETFGPTGGRDRTPNHGRFRDYNINNYFEYGATSDLTVINSLTYKWLYNETDQFSSKGYGLGDVDLGLRYKFLDSPKAGIVSTQFLVKIPGTYSRNDPLPLGNAQYDAELRVLYGRSLYPLIPGYANVELGYRWRAQDPSDEFRYLVEFGIDITRSLYARTKLDGIMSVDNGKKFDGGGNPTATNNFDLGKVEITVGYKFTPAWGVEATYRPDVYGQNIAAGTNYSLALFVKTP